MPLTGGPRCARRQGVDILVGVSKAHEERLAKNENLFRALNENIVEAPGHEDIEIEQVVADRNAYVVVEKDGAAGLVAHAEDPRA
jgi:hypothetical protein